VIPFFSQPRFTQGITHFASTDVSEAGNDGRSAPCKAMLDPFDRGGDNLPQMLLGLSIFGLI